MTKKSNKLTVSKQRELEEWPEKIRSGEAEKIVRKMFFDGVVFPFDPKYNLHKVAQEIMPNVYIKRQKTTDEEKETITQLLIDFGIETDVSMAESIEVRYRGLMINLRRELIKEYECKTYSEKALVDIVVGAYARNLSMTKMLTHTATKGSTTPNLNSFMAVMSKEVDRANRQFLTALESLRQMKQPSLSINVKTKNTFIGQNQEFNHTSHEVIEAK